MTGPGRRGVRLELLALAVCLFGLLGFLLEVPALKRAPGSVPRIVLLGLLALIAAPFYPAMVRRPQPLFLIAPVVIVFLLYPMAAPDGVVFYRDPIFNFHFADVSAANGVWSPGTFPVWARVYSYYPVGNLFLGITIAASGAPGAYAFAWAEPLLRLLAIPTAVYAIARTFFEPRISALAVLFYLGTSSILFNNPVQQGMGAIFFALSVLALARLSKAEDPEQRFRLRAVFVLCSTALVFTHHLSSYMFLAWLGPLTAMAFQRRYRSRLQSLRLELHLDAYLATLAIAIALVTTPVLLSQLTTAEGVLLIFVEPQEAAGGGLGHTFATWEVAWLGMATLAPAVLAYVTIRSFRKRGVEPFLVPAGLVAFGLLGVTLPLLATKLNYIPLRISEFTNLLLAPLAAATVVRWVRSLREGTFVVLRWRVPYARGIPVAALAVGLALIVIGGSLAPLSFRPYYELPKDRLSDSPLYLGDDALRAASWAQLHFGGARVWGDQLVLSVFAGFADMDAEFGQYRVFANASMNGSAWNRLQIGDYVVVDRYMQTALPDFLDTMLPTGPLPAANVEKFGRDPHFALVYQDGTFSVYVVLSKP